MKHILFPQLELSTTLIRHGSIHPKERIKKLNQGYLTNVDNLIKLLAMNVPSSVTGTTDLGKDAMPYSADRCFSWLFNVPESQFTSI